MGTPSVKEKNGLSADERNKLRGELWIIIPFFLFSLYLFGGSFRYKFEASTVPMIIGLGTAILTGMRLFYILYPQFRIGEFKEAGLAGEFDHMKEEIEQETLKGRTEEPAPKEVAFVDEKKAFICIIGCFVVFLLLGYIVGTFFVIVGSSYYYNYKDKVPLLISLASLYLIVYVVLYKLLDAPADFGLLLEPILRSLNLL